MSLPNYTSDPVAFMQRELHFQQWSKQREIAEALRDHERVAVTACNASGKSALAGACVPWWLAGGPGSIVLTTSATERQLKRVLWREVHRHYRQAAGLFDGAVLTELEVFLREDWYAVGLGVDTVEAFQGHHGSRVLVIVDEASGVPEGTWEAVEGVLAGGEAKLLAISNPLRTSGSFYDAFTRNRDEWKLLRISAYDTPNLTGEKVSKQASKRLVSRRWVERQAKRGEGSNEYRIRVLGEFPSESEDSVLSLGDLQAAHAQNLEPGFPLVIGCDIARFGSDQNVLSVRRGNVIRVARSYGGRDLMQTTGAITELARALTEEHGRRPVIVVDDVGLGGGVTDRLRELGEFRVIDHNGGRKASSRDYPNRRSELWFQFAELLPVLDLDPADEELGADLLAPTYSLASDAKRVVEQKQLTKRRLRRSPDRADSVMLTCVFEPPQTPGRSRGPRPYAGLGVARGHIGDAVRGRGAPARAHARLVARQAQREADQRYASELGIPVNQRFLPSLRMGTTSATTPPRRST